MNEFNELIYFDDEKDVGSGDFNGAAASFDIDEQIEFLRKYAEMYESIYGDETGKAFDESDIDAVTENFAPDDENRVRKAIKFDEMDAVAVPAKNEFEDVIFYTKKAVRAENAILFADGDIPPMPCAEVRLRGTELKKFVFGIYMDSEYKGNLRAGVDTTVSGRSIELRDGISEILKLQFYANGEIYARRLDGGNYHHQNIKVGEFGFDKFTRVELEFSDDMYTVTIDGKSKSVRISNNGTPDRIFIGGGMHPTGKWKFEPVEAVYSDGKTVRDFFKPYCGDGKSEIELGKKKMPFALGTQVYADYILKLHKKFKVTKPFENVVLNIGSLDPDGEAYINGIKVCDTNNFLAVRVDISEYLRMGDNELEIRINPRAPEVLYSWHRHRDPYNGWFARDVFIEFVGDCRVEFSKAVTLSVDNGIKFKLETRISSNKGRRIVYRVYINETSVCERDVELSVGETVLSDIISFDGGKWDTENPILHRIRVELSENGIELDDYAFNTGFRIIEQKDGEIYLNGKRIILKGALLMQFLPPFDEIPINHVCPSERQLAMQALIGKGMNCNTLRMHQLGYGTNDSRLAEICDKLGIMLIWTTRLIDSVEGVIWHKEWRQKEYYKKQICENVNHPSIIMWEGSNEFFPYRADINNVYKEFVNGVKEADGSRLICPISHLYYANDSYNKNCEYFQEDGEHDEYFNPCAPAVKEWDDESVVRSAHTYERLLGYGSDWQTFREQKWSAQKSLLESGKHAYIISEYAVIGRNDGNVPEAADYFNGSSYEIADEEKLFGNRFASDTKISQSYQALAAKYATKYMLSKDVDGLLWCCLTSGANNASYMKPPVDFYGYKKLAYYALKESFQENICFQSGVAVCWGKNTLLSPVIVCDKDDLPHTVRIEIYDESDNAVQSEEYTGVVFDSHIIELEKRKVRFSNSGYYRIKYTII